MRQYLILDILKKVLMAISIVVGIVFKDLDVLLWGMVAASILTLVIYATYSGRAINYSPLDQIRDLLPTFLICVIISLIVGLATGLFLYFIKDFWYDITWTNLAAVAVGLIVGALLILVFYKFLPKKEVQEIKNLLFNRL